MQVGLNHDRLARWRWQAWLLCLVGVWDLGAYALSSCLEAENLPPGYAGNLNRQAGRGTPASPHTNVHLAGQAAAPLNWTTQQDHKQMLGQLGITRLRPGPSGQPGATNSANYDPAKADPFPSLPEALTLKDGRKVTTAAMWWNQRRPEIIEDFEREVIGRVPENPPRGHLDGGCEHHEWIRWQPARPRQAARRPRGPFRLPGDQRGHPHGLGGPGPGPGSRAGAHDVRRGRRGRDAPPGGFPGAHEPLSGVWRPL